MPLFRTHHGELVEAHGAMVGLFRSRGYREVKQSATVPVRPSKSASKAAWVEYAVSVGIDPDGLNRSQIIEAVERLS